MLLLEQFLLLQQMESDLLIEQLEWHRLYLQLNFASLFHVFLEIAKRFLECSVWIVHS